MKSTPRAIENSVEWVDLQPMKTIRQDGLCGGPCGTVPAAMVYCYPTEHLNSAPTFPQRERLHAEPSTWHLLSELPNVSCRPAVLSGPYADGMGDSTATGSHRCGSRVDETRSAPNAWPRCPKRHAPSDGVPIRDVTARGR